MNDIAAFFYIAGSFCFGAGTIAAKWSDWFGW